MAVFEFCDVPFIPHGSDLNSVECPPLSSSVSSYPGLAALNAKRFAQRNITQRATLSIFLMQSELDWYFFVAVTNGKIKSKVTYILMPVDIASYIFFRLFSLKDE